MSSEYVLLKELTKPLMSRAFVRSKHWRELCLTLVVRKVNIYPTIGNVYRNARIANILKEHIVIW